MFEFLKPKTTHFMQITVLPQKNLKVKYYPKNVLLLIDHSETPVVFQIFIYKAFWLDFEILSLKSNYV